MRHQNKRLSLDSPGLELREEVHPEYVEAAEAGRRHDAKVAGDNVPDAELVHLARLGRRGAIGGAEHDRGKPGAGIDLRVARGLLGYRGYRSAAVDQHAPLYTVDRGQHPEVAVRRHPDPQVLAGDLLIVESEPARETRQLRLVGRLLQDNEDQEREQPERKSEANDPTDVRNALQ